MNSKQQSIYTQSDQDCTDDNLRTAKAVGLAIQRSVLRRARGSCRLPAGAHPVTPSTSDVQLISPENRIGYAVLTVFHVTRQPVFEGSVAVDTDDQVVPAMEGVQ